jgi:hypothetical protein
MTNTYEKVITHFDNEFIKLTDSEGVEHWIPLEPANTDYQEYLASLEATEPEAE